MTPITQTVQGAKVPGYHRDTGAADFWASPEGVGLLAQAEKAKKEKTQ
jgi:hypothetical protein